MRIFPWIIIRNIDIYFTRVTCPYSIARVPHKGFNTVNYNILPGPSKNLAGNLINKSVFDLDNHNMPDFLLKCRIIYMKTIAIYFDII
ncbi:MAG: hypothetical protein C0399_01190 [Syntrophus sp. (in: bacteria)]|nr:hypothetical protein [Syntrophus sp. (in: bacteria)]